MGHISLNKLERLTLEWAQRHGLLAKPSQASLTRQVGRVIEELANLERAIEEKDQPAAMSAIGAMTVALVVRAELLNQLDRIDGFPQALLAVVFATPIASTKTLFSAVFDMAEKDKAGYIVVCQLARLARQEAKTELRDCLQKAYFELQTHSPS